MHGAFACAIGSAVDLREDVSQLAHVDLAVAVAAGDARELVDRERRLHPKLGELAVAVNRLGRLRRSHIARRGLSEWSTERALGAARRLEADGRPS